MAEAQLWSKTLFLRMALTVTISFVCKHRQNLQPQSAQASTYAGKHAGRANCPDKPDDPSSILGTASLPVGVAIAVRAVKGALCGKGDMSIESFAGPGEDEGIGGVNVFSVWH